MTIDETNIISDNDEAKALAILLANEICFLNTVDIQHTYKNYKSPIYTTCVYVNCSDLFDYACADAECIVSNDGEPGSEIISLYQMYKEDSKWGVEKWLSIKRNLQPIPGVKIRMISDNSWDDIMESLPKNHWEK
jgi:hypothetical protein